jgi:hypothetical protein
MAKELSALGCRIITVQEHKSDLGNKTRYADKKYVVEGVDTNEEIATKFYLDLLKRESIDLVIPLSDFQLVSLQSIKKRLKKHPEPGLPLTIIPCSCRRLINSIQ